MISDDPRPSELEAETVAPENGSDGKQSGEGHDIDPTEQGPPTTAPVTEEQTKPAVDPTVAKHVNDVMTSEVNHTHPIPSHWRQSKLVLTHSSWASQPC